MGRLKPDQLAETMKQWLAHRNFEANPFTEYQADRESRLSEYFIPTPYYDEILGSNETPRTMVIYAARGCGKTAHRIMVAKACRENDTLAVEYTDFGPLPRQIAQPHGSVNLHQHLERILRSGVEAFVEAAIRDPAMSVSLAPEWLARLKWFCLQYHPEVLEATGLADRLRALAGGDLPLDWHGFRQAREMGRLEEMLAAQPVMERPSARFLVALSDMYPEPLVAEHLSEAQLFGYFVELVRRAGFKAVYVLVDRVDEPAELSSNLDLAADFIAPLLADLPLMECPHAAFKFFLPMEMYGAVRAKPFVRHDRLLFRRIEWEPEALRALLRHRLIAFSGGEVEDLAMISDGTLQKGIDEAIVHHAGGMPRNLLRLGEALFTAHCRQAEEGRETLSQDDWDAALSEFYGKQLPAQLRLPRHPLLRLDCGTKTVYIGTRVVPGLSGALFHLLWYMYERSGRVIGNAELVDIAGSDQALRKNISRIREKIEPDPRKPVYLENVPGLGYRLTNTQPQGRGKP